MKNTLRYVLIIAIAGFILLACKNPVTSGFDSRKDANLSSIAVIAAGQQRPLIPAFSPSVTSYQVHVPPGTSSVLFVGTPSNQLANLVPDSLVGTASDDTTALTFAQTLQGVTVSGFQTGQNRLSAQVRSADGSTTKTYQLTVVVNPITLSWEDDQSPITEQDTTNGRTFTFSLPELNLATAGITVTLPVTITDAENQIGGGSVTSLTFSNSAQTPSITLTGRSTDDGNTNNETVSISFGTPTITGSNAANYSFPTPTDTIEFVVVDDDVVAVVSSLSTSRITEGGTATLSLTLQNPGSQNVEVTPTATGLTFAPESVSLTAASPSATITISSTDDDVDNPTRLRTIVIGRNPETILPLPTSLQLAVDDNDLPAPTQLVASASDAQVTLRWQGVPGATSYQIYRATDGGSATRLTTNPNPLITIFYTDFSAQNEREYTYTIRAINSTEASGDSNSVTVTPQDHGNTREEATPIRIGQTITGRTGGGDEDFFRIQLQAGQNVTIASGGDATNPLGRLMDRDGTVIVAHNDINAGRGNLNFSITREITETGTYYIQVIRAGVPSGPYTLSVTLN
ncbi:MAG: cadherin-like beta sandwich domain-containing protein [Spirochaetales bacterium]|nr:cadherin-like beta sandwich domain-containing protein [Spirochaetales bacterium]